MREPIIQTMVNKFLTWLSKKSVTALYKQTHFWAFSWGLDEHTDLYLFSEESYHDRHRFGLHEETYERKTENSSEKPNNCEPQTIRCPKCGRTDYIRDMEKDMGIKGSHYKYKCINCNTYIKDEPKTERSSE